MATARDLIRGALRKIGAIAVGESPSAEELSDALLTLNGMLGSWANEGLMIYATTREELSVPGGQSSYSIGTTADLATSRPQMIELMNVKVNGSEIPVESLTLSDWMAITSKDVLGTYPTKFYYEASYPNGTFYFWPKPAQTNTIVLVSKKAFSAIATANDTVALPPGYDWAIEHNLAVALALEFGRSASPEVLAIASESKANLKRINMRPEFLETDRALLADGRQFNILTGESR